MQHPLAGCRAKLDRAREHVEAFYAAYSDYFHPRPFDVRGVYDSDTGWYSFVPVDLRPPPLRIGIIVGDVVHNLRSALDHLVWQAALRNDAQPDPLSQFPICDDEQAWASAAGRSLKDVGTADVEAIKRSQPFMLDSDVFGALGPWALRQLRDLSNEDKHRVVTPMVGAIGADVPISFGKVSGLPAGATLVAGRDVKTLGESETFLGVPLDGTVPIVRVRIEAAGPDPQVELRAQAIADFLLEGGGLLRYAIAEMGLAVEKIVDDFERRWAIATGVPSSR